jgi:hypothetical protein
MQLLHNVAPGAAVPNDTDAERRKPRLHVRAPDARLAIEALCGFDFVASRCGRAEVTDRRADHADARIDRLALPRGVNPRRRRAMREHEGGVWERRYPRLHLRDENATRPRENG